MVEKKKVAIFHCGFIYSGGGERIILEEAKGLKKRGWEVSVFAPTLDKKLCFPEEVERLNVKTFLPQLPSFIPGRFAMQMVLSSLFAPFFTFRFTDVDVFVGGNQPGAWIAFCVSRVLGKPYITYLNQPNRLLYHRKIDKEVNWQNLTEYYFIDDLIKLLRPFISFVDKISSIGGKTVLVNGGYIGKIIKNIYKSEVTVCPAGAYPQEFKNLKLNPHTAYTGSFRIKNLKRVEFEIKKPYIFLTNRHVPQKKFEYGIQALKEVVEKFPNVLLVIPGPFTSYTPELMRIADLLGVSKNVLFLGQISEENLQKLYQAAAVYIYTAPEEDFGMGVIEAMGWGVPVVAWNYAGPTVTVENGKTGYLAKPYDISDFAQKLLETLKDSKTRSEMGKHAWEHVKNNFSWERHVDILEKTIRKAIN